MLDGNGTCGTVRTHFERELNAYIEEITCIVFVVRLGVYCTRFPGFFLENAVSARYPIRKYPKRTGVASGILFSPEVKRCSSCACSRVDA